MLVGVFHWAISWRMSRNSTFRRRVSGEINVIKGCDRNNVEVVAFLFRKNESSVKQNKYWKGTLLNWFISYNIISSPDGEIGQWSKSSNIECSDSALLLMGLSLRGTHL